jgi:hypothetical protein
VPDGDLQLICNRHPDLTFCFMIYKILLPSALRPNTGLSDTRISGLITQAKLRCPELTINFADA